MDQESYAKIKSFVRANLILNLHGELDDCVQYVAMRACENPKASWKYCLIDWCRENGFSSSRPKRTAVPLGMARSQVEFEHEHDAHEPSHPGSIDVSDLDRIISMLSGRDRHVLEMRGDGLSFKEIGERFGVTESRVQQICNRAIGDARKMMASDLSRSEQDVVKHVLLGLSNKEIGERLFVTEKTVKFHLTNIYKKLDVGSRAQLSARYANHPDYNPLSISNAVTTEAEGDSDMSNWEPMNPKPIANLPLSSAQHGAIQKADAQDQVNFVVNTFKINDTIDHLHTMSKEVTRGDYSVEKVMAACQCIGRMNETINTVMKAAQALRGR